ncbi:MAG: imidazole glycerol phosphate synthase subunit HisF [Flammeovirgaceae bacterium]|nr:MAG: imidazole glycerol phosphate synthase subunit HisF [Flammeovirgaceae bacterium]
MLGKRIIPCLDVAGGRTVKGVNFSNLRDAGDPVELAATYASQGADELVFLDISATLEERKPMTTWVKAVARQINIPFTVGGGISTLNDVDVLLNAGADKVSINSAAVRNPHVLDELAGHFGSQCIVLAIDARKIHNSWVVHTHGGKNPTDKKLFSWAKEGQERGAGEILFTSMDHDGTKNGFALDPLEKLHHLLTIPVIASGGAGTMGHFADAFALAKADAALAASIFHFGEISIPELKKFLHKHHIPVRL